MSEAPAIIAPTTGDVAYLYGVARLAAAIDAAPLCRSAILPDAAVTTVAHGDLVAFFSEVPASLFAPDEFRIALPDTAWLEARIVAHDKVLKELSGLLDLLPLRFGVICPDLAKIREMLVRNHDAFERALTRIAGAAEWGVKIWADVAALSSHVESTSPAIRGQRAAMQSTGPGAQYFLSRKLERTLDEAVRAHVTAVVDDIHRQLATAVRQAVPIPVQAVPAGPVARVAVMNGAYLVERVAASDFGRLVERLRAPLAEHGLSCELSGPWPPYHFVSTSEDHVDDGTSAR